MLWNGPHRGAALHTTHTQGVNDNSGISDISKDPVRFRKRDPITIVISLIVLQCRHTKRDEHSTNRYAKRQKKSHQTYIKTELIRASNSNPVRSSKIHFWHEPLAHTYRWHRWWADRSICEWLVHPLLRLSDQHPIEPKKKCEKTGLINEHAHNRIS